MLTPTRNIATLARNIETELDKKITDRVTWGVVETFWASDVSIPADYLVSLIGKVDLLSARMREQHGWKRN